VGDAAAGAPTTLAAVAVIAHLSDFHLGDDPVAEARFTAVLDRLAGLAERVDAILVTGDVLDDPAVGDYAAIGRRLRALGRPVVACPGNHDDRAGFRALLDLPAGDGPVDSLLVAGGVTVVACDTSVPGAPHGRLEESTLRRLAAALADAGDGPILIGLHHVPVALDLPLVDRIGLREQAGLERLVRGASGVVGVVCGHAHTAAATTFAGVPLVVAPAVSSTLLHAVESGAEDVFDREQPPGFVLHVVDGGRLTSHVRWAPTA